jgi:hypothetical protein
MKFPNIAPLEKIKITILDDPISALDKSTADIIVGQNIDNTPKVVLPLYSLRGNPRKVQERAGLNQWNAKGRKNKKGVYTSRHPDEVYIPVPLWIHKKFSDFFPPRSTNFKLKLPDGNVINASICQQGGKSLMSNPNKALGEWLLRKILKTRRGHLITYDKLKKLGVDSVAVKKINTSEYSIDFASEGSYDTFEKENC